MAPYSKRTVRAFVVAVEEVGEWKSAIDEVAWRHIAGMDVERE